MSTAARGTGGIFISYSRHNEALAGQIADGLRASGYNVWLDLKELERLQDWWPAIQDAILQAKAIVFLISGPSLASHVCHLELHEARKHNKKIAPIHAEKADLLLTSVLEQFNTQPMKPYEQLLYAAALQETGETVETTIQRNIEAVSAPGWWFFSETGPISIADQVKALGEGLKIDWDYRAQHTELESDAERWESDDRSAALLKRDDQLRKWAVWLEQAGVQAKSPSPTAIQRTYIADAQIAQRRNARIRRLIQVAGVVLTLGVVIAFGIAAILSEIARNQRRTTVATALYGDSRSEYSISQYESSYAHGCAAFRASEDLSAAKDAVFKEAERLAGNLSAQAALDPTLCITPETRAFLSADQVALFLYYPALDCWWIDQFKCAEAGHRAALALKPVDYLVTQHSLQLAIVLRDQQRYDEAFALLKAGRATVTDDNTAMQNRYRRIEGSIYFRQAAYQKALDILVPLADEKKGMTGDVFFEDVLYFLTVSSDMLDRKVQACQYATDYFKFTENGGPLKGIDERYVEIVALRKTCPASP